jgi:DNA-binding NtrC family response regulator
MEATVVVIDDDCDDLDIMKEALTCLDSNIICFCYQDAEEAIDAIANELIVYPNYVFIDINMSPLSGFDCLMKLRANDDLKDVTIVMCSTFMPLEIASALIKHGANFTLQKPVAMQEYYAILKGILEA